ncbi:hypothetical protein OTU49_009211, partial [Cherax quadricarinatus]
MHNDLSALRPDFPAFFPKLQVAKLSGNTWDCSRSSQVIWMKHWMTHSPVHFYRSYSIRCSTPASFGYKPVMLLEDTDFPSSTAFNSSELPSTTSDSTTILATLTTSPAHRLASAIPTLQSWTRTPFVKVENVSDTGSAEDSESELWVNDTARYSQYTPAGGPLDTAKGADSNSSLASLVTLSPDSNYFKISTLEEGASSEKVMTEAPSQGFRELVGVNGNSVGTTSALATALSATSREGNATKGMAPTATPTPATTAGATATTSRASIKTHPYWVIHNRMPPKNLTLTARHTSTTLPVKAHVQKTAEERRIKKILKKAKKNERGSSRTPQREDSGHRPVTLDHNKDLWIYRGDNSHGLSPGQPLPLGLGHGRVSDGAVVGAGIVASCVGIALLVGGFLLARGRGKAGHMWEGSTYWREGSDDDVVMAVGATGVVTETEGTVGVVTETHRGLNNRLYLLLQRDSVTGITPDTLPDPRGHSP